MIERAFVEESDRPDAQTLDVALGTASSLFKQVETLTGSYTQAWQYAKKAGWIFKVSDRRKALLYLIPLRGAVAVSMAVRDQEHQALLADPKLAGIRDTIVGSRRVSEGYAMRFEVSTEEEYLPVAHLITVVMSLRCL